MHQSIRVFVLILLCFLPLTHAALLINYSPTQPLDTFGLCQLEGQELFDSVPCPGTASTASITTSPDPSGNPSLHFHRTTHFRRAEIHVGAADDPLFNAGQTLFIGYHFLLSHIADGLVIFQWKRDDKEVEPADNIPFHLEFEGGMLNLQVTTPGGSGSERATVAKAEVSVGVEHRVALAFDTRMNGGETVSKGNRLAWWVDGVKVHDAGEYSLWSEKTKTFPKVGIYRGEGDRDDDDDDPKYTFDSYVYRLQISDSGMDEISDSSGVTGSG